MKTEQCLLGSVLLLPDVCDDIASIVRPMDFYDEVHQRIFHEIIEMHDAGRKVDTQLLAERLTKQGAIEEIGGLRYLAELAGTVPHPGHAVDYARTIRDYAERRELIGVSADVLQQAYDSDQETRDLVNIAEQRVFAILDNRQSSSVTSMSEMLHVALDRLDARMRNEHTLTGTETGFVDLDQLLGGLHQSELVILAARPSMGKTAFAMNIAEHAAIRDNRPVLFVSLEMSQVELIDRMLCSIAEVNSQKLRNGSISKEERRRLVSKASEISSCPLFVDDSPSRTVLEISAAARRIKRKETELSLIVIDYLQLIEPDNPRDPRQEQVAKIARRLKGLARELNVPVLCLAQLNRQTEAMKDNRPRLSHLRESGA
ncbi:MAG: replicative DNA helicase, partial [Planctomycetota bacterium]